MIEIRLHGRGGQGTVRAGEILVNTIVRQGRYGNSIPYFGFERRGSPVSAFVRIDDVKIRPKTQVYNPDCLIIMDDTIQNSVDIFKGIKDNCKMVLNTNKELKDIDISPKVTVVGLVDATDISLKLVHKNIPNTVTGCVDIGLLKEEVVNIFGEANGELLQQGYDSVSINNIKSGV
jgi:pyruvate ferredoxin oxidoreductase gamma subunit/phenylglyoxylate dehydrogenase gamma subunit